MRLFVVLFCVVALGALALSSPRHKRQIVPDDNDLSPGERPGEGDLSDRWWWGNRPTRPARPTRPTTSSTTSPPEPSPPSPDALDRCMRNCQRTPQYDPICTTLTTGLRKTYTNSGERMCAELCGEASTILFRGLCVAIS